MALPVWVTLDFEMYDPFIYYVLSLYFIIIFYFFHFIIIIFNSYFPNMIFFLLYSMVTQLHIHVHILFSHIIMLRHKWVDIVPRAT